MLHFWKKLTCADIFGSEAEVFLGHLPALGALRLRDGNPVWKVCWKHINPKKWHSFQTGCRLEDVFGGKKHKDCSE